MDQSAENARLPLIGRLRLAEVLTSLRCGWWDFRAAPLFGLFFGAVCVVAGIGLIVIGAGSGIWTLALALGFPLVAPFAAVGLYEVSRRLEAEEPLLWRAVLGVVWRERHRQIRWMGAVLLIFFLFWIFLAHLIFALFMGPSAFSEVSSSFAVFLTPRGLAMLTTEMLVGAVLAFLLFALTAVSLPLLLEREVDFIAAMRLSFRAVQANFWPMLLWAAIIAVLTLIAMLPMFLGLLVVLPILGHATWHLYRRVLYDPV